MQDIIARAMAAKALKGGGGGSSDAAKLKQGYYYDGQFYEDAAHTTLITGNTKNLYVDKETNLLYAYNGTSFVLTSIIPTSVNGLTGGTDPGIQGTTLIVASDKKDYALTVQSNADDGGGAYEGGSYIGFTKKNGNVLGYLGIDRDLDAVLNKGGKDYKLGFPISDYIRGRRMFNSQGAVTLPFGSIAVTVDSNLTISWNERQDASLIPHSITTHGPCIMFLTKIGNSGVKNEKTMASAVIAYKTNDLDFFETRKFLTNTEIQIRGNGMLYYVSATDLGTDP